MDSNDPRYLQVESGLSTLLRERTGYEISDLDRDATFMELGFDSLFLIQLSQQLKQRFKVKVSFRQLIEEITTVNTLVPHLAEQQPQAAESTIAVAAVPPSPAPVVAQPVVAIARATNPAPAPVTQPPAESSVNNIASSTVAPPLVPVAPAPVSMAPPAKVLAPAVALPSLPAGAISGVEQIILQQNQLMAQHLAILSGQPAMPPTTPAVPASVPLAEAVSTPAATAPTMEAECCGDVGSCESNVSDGEAPRAFVKVPTGVAEAAKTPTKRERFGPYKPVRKGPGNGLTDRQKSHLDQFINRFTRRTAKSKQLADTHRSHFADPRGVAGYRRIWKSMVYQIAVEKSKGAHLRDIDGNRYVDIAMGFGLNLFGQSPDFVTKAIHEQLDRGVEVGPQSPIAGEVAKMLCGFSRKERVTFCNTGSEAVMAALRLARTVTGKSKFVYFNKDYHGNFDQVLCRSTSVGQRRIASPAAPGVPQMFADNSIVLDYGTPEALRVIQEEAEDIAAVLIEPVQSADPFLQPKEFLHEIRRITSENNIAMIMDEVITGFRAAQGGAQEWFGVWGDMSTYGKILGGGMPIGALAGSRHYMDALDGGVWNYDDDSEPEADMTFFAGTFVRHPLGLVAAHEILKKVTAEGPQLQQRLTDRTTYLVESLNTFFESEQFPIRVAQFASQFRFMFPPDLEYADMLYFHMLDRGVFTRGWGDNCFLSTAHTDDDVEYVISAIQDSCLEIRRGGFFPDAVDEAASIAAHEANEKKNDRPLSPLASHGLLASPVDSNDRPVDYPPSSDAMSTLVDIQPEGTKTPIFCTPAADGFTRVYHELSDRLGDDQPLYGIDSPGIYGEALPDTLEEFCAGMVNDIREVQSHGPYVLLGYCSGGTVALEIAQQLIAAGERVAMLGMIETYNWATAPSTNPSFWTQMGYEHQRIEFHFRNFLLLDRTNKRVFLKSKWDALKIRTRVWKASFRSKFSKAKRDKPKALVDFNELWRKHDELCEEYMPRTYPGKLVHFRPRRDYKCHLGEELQATDGMEEHRMRAYPAGMMVSPFVDELADMLRQTIETEVSCFVDHDELAAPESGLSDAPVSQDAVSLVGE